MGDTATSVNQGGASGSTGIQLGGKQMRVAAAEARRVLVEMAAQKLGLAADQLTVTDGVVQAKSDAAKKATYAELIGGRYFNVQLDWNKQIGQHALRARQGQAEGPQGLQDRRQADPARRHRADGLLPGGLLHRREAPGHAACAHDPSAGRGRGADQGRRSVDQGHPRRQGLSGEGLPRGLRRQGVGRHQGLAEAQGRMVGREAAVRRSGRALRSHPQGPRAQARGRRQAGRQRRRGVQDRGPRDRGRVRMAVPVACLHGTGLRAGRGQGRPCRPAGPGRRSRTSCRTASPARSACRPTRCT